MFRRLLSGLATRISSQCAVCHAWPAEPVCENCIALFAQPITRCQACALPVATGVRFCGACIHAPPPLDGCLAAVAYSYPWSNLVTEFKFRQHPAWARHFALLMRSTPWVEPALEAADLVIPMPLSPQRMRERGYNQAQLLAQALDFTKVNANVLLRIAHTPAQSSLRRKARLEQVRNAFAIDPMLVGQVDGKRIALIDDVMTTGASLHAAATVLRRSGATHITALVLARTGNET